MFTFLREEFFGPQKPRLWLWLAKGKLRPRFWREEGRLEQRREIMPATFFEARAKIALQNCTKSGVQNRPHEKTTDGSSLSRLSLADTYAHTRVAESRSLIDVAAGHKGRCAH